MEQKFERGDLLKVLRRAEAAIPGLLKNFESNLDQWHSRDVNYEPPRVERLWTTFEKDYRLYLHRIHPCEVPLYHPHPWPSAVKIVSGEYEMDVGYGPGEVMPPVAMTLRLGPGSYYEMIDRDGWHSVKPLLTPTLSVMVTGRPWNRWSPAPPKGALRSLNGRVELDLLMDFQIAYGIL
jgi:hypothetical protein